MVIAMTTAKETQLQRAIRIAETNNGATLRVRNIVDKKKQWRRSRQGASSIWTSPPYFLYYIQQRS